MILRLTRGRCDVLVAPQFAFRKNHQAHEVIFILRQLIEKALEWDMGLFLMDGDVRKAYDFTKHSQLIKGMQKKGVEHFLIAAIIREIRRSKMEIIVDSVTRTGGWVVPDQFRRATRGCRFTSTPLWTSRRAIFGRFVRRKSGDGSCTTEALFVSYFLQTIIGWWLEVLNTLS